jgi:secretion/DNA translocation related TadE-like protein
MRQRRLAHRGSLNRPDHQWADHGSATIWVLACASLVLVVAIALTVRTTSVVARHHAESAADFAALAAASEIGIVATPREVCAAAPPIAAANGGKLLGCIPTIDPDGRSGSVTVRVSVAVRLPVLGTVPATATARAGRLSIASDATSDTAARTQSGA